MGVHDVVTPVGAELAALASRVGATDGLDNHAILLGKGATRVDRAVTASRRVSDGLRVVLQGRTTAGKSTLLEALSRGDGARRGVGAQRTTRDTCERDVAVLPGVTIVDVPGVGAADGEEDRAIALAELDSADIVLWVATNEAPKNDTAEAIQHIAARGKPVIVAVNCRQSIELAPHRSRFLRDLDRVFSRAAELTAVVEKHVQSQGGTCVTTVPIHADAAFRAVRGESDSSALQAASRIDNLVDALRHEQERAPQRRLLRSADAVRVALLEAASDLDAVTASIGESRYRSEGYLDADRQRTKRAIDDFSERAAATVRALIEDARPWSLSVDVRSGVDARWNQEIRLLDDRIGEALAICRRELQASIELAERESGDEWLRSDTAVAPRTMPPPLEGMGKAWARRGVQGGILALGFTLALPTGGLSVPVAATIATASVVVSFATPHILRFVEAKLPDRAGILQRRRRRLREQWDHALDSLERGGQGAARQERDGLMTVLEEQTRASERVIRELVDLESRCALCREHIVEAVHTLDALTAGALLGVVGRPAESRVVRRASRTPGLAMLVEVDDAGYSTLVLDPVDSVEYLAAVPCKGAVPAADVIRTAPALRLVLEGATERRVILRDGASRTDDQRNAIGELLARFSGAEVVVHPSMPTEEGHAR